MGARALLRSGGKRQDSPRFRVGRQAAVDLGRSGGGGQDAAVQEGSFIFCDAALDSVEAVKGRQEFRRDSTNGGSLLLQLHTAVQRKPSSADNQDPRTLQRELDTKAHLSPPSNPRAPLPSR